MARLTSRVALAVTALLCLSAVVPAQETTTTTQTKSFEVISVDGNQLVVKLPEGTRQLTVPDDFTFDVDGKQVSVRELRPGMKGTAHITTRTTVTPVTVTEVKNGTVMQASGASLIVRTDEGIKMFSPGDVEKRNVKLMRDGQPLEFSSLHAGDTLTATIVTTHPPKVVTEKQVQATLAREGAAPAGSAAANIAATSGTSAEPAGAAPAGSARKLPKTASPQPLIGLVALISLTAAVVLTARRRWLEP
jgi:hypothetical protein